MLHNERNFNGVLILAKRIAHTVGVCAPNTISDLNVEFFENVITSFTDYSNRSVNGSYRRYHHLLKYVSSLVSTPLNHISVKNLCQFKPNDLYNLVEIIEFLSDSAFAAVYNVETKNMNSGIFPDQFEKPLYKCENNVNEKLAPKIHSSQHDQSFVSSCKVTISTCDLKSDMNGDGFQSRSVSDIASSFSITTTHSKDNQSIDKTSDDLRTTYFRRKLSECLDNCQFIKPYLNKDDLSIRTISSIQSESEHQFEGDTCIKYKYNSQPNSMRSGLIKQSTKLLINPAFNMKAKLSQSNDSMDCIQLDRKSTYLFDQMLELFPYLDLNSNEKKILRQKAVNLFSKYSKSQSQSTNFCTDTSSRIRHPETWIEERQRRRLAQLMLHDRQVDRLKEQRISEAIDRHVRTETRERRYQLVRARKYYREFVREFRARKLSKIFAEEQVFRQFFEQLLHQEKQYMLEIRKLERQESQNFELQKQKELEILKYNHRLKIEMTNEDLQKQREERIALLREERDTIKQQKKELRRILEHNIHRMQTAFLSNQDSVHFRERDANRILQNSVQFILK